VAGRAGPPVPTRDRAAAIRFLVADASGHLVEIQGAAEARRVPGVVEVGLTRQPGQDVRLRGSFQDRLGYVIASGADLDAAVAAARTGQLALKARIVPGPNDQG
jgi:biotin carboxylase